MNNRWRCCQDLAVHSSAHCQLDLDPLLSAFPKSTSGPHPTSSRWSPLFTPAAFIGMSACVR